MNRVPANDHRPRDVARLFVLSFILLLLLSGGASAKTSVTAFGPAHLATSLVKPPGVVPNVKVLSTALVHVTLTFPGATTRAGTQVPGTVGLSGTTAVLAACPASTCTDPYRGSGAARLRTNDYAEVLHLQVTQPSATGSRTGFDAELAVHLSTGWVVLRGYVSTGTHPTGAATTIDLDLYLDLGVRTPPTVLAVEVSLQGCASSTRCP